LQFYLERATTIVGAEAFARVSSKEKKRSFFLWPRRCGEWRPTVSLCGSRDRVDAGLAATCATLWQRHVTYFITVRSSPKRAA